MDKRKRTMLSINQKLEIINKLASGVPVSRICEQYDIKKQTVSDIKKNTERINKFALLCDVGNINNNRIKMRFANNALLEEALMKWYIQQRSYGIPVRALELKTSVIKLGKHMNINVKASDGWLWRFRKRHGISNKRIYGDAMSCAVEEIEPFRQKFKEFMTVKNFSKFQIYNADETGLLWRSLPENTQAYNFDKNTPGRKSCKDRISALLCANADGSHRLTPVIVGKSRKPRVLKDAMHSLPIVYYNSKKAWFTSEIFKNWFFNHFVPDVIKFQRDKLGIPLAEATGLLLLDNCPAHPSESILRTVDGKFTCMFLPKNTTALIQPMDQGIILATKRLYRRKFLDEVMVVCLDEKEEEDTRGQRTVQNLKNYNIKSAIYNFASAWKEVKELSLTNGWINLFNGIDEDIDIDLDGIEVRDFYEVIQNNGETKVAEDDVYEWLEIDEGDPGYNIMTEVEIADQLLKEQNNEESESTMEENTPRRVKISTITSHLTDLIAFIDTSLDSDFQQYSMHFRLFRELIIKKQRALLKQTTLDSFLIKSSCPKQLECKNNVFEDEKRDNN